MHIGLARSERERQCVTCVWTTREGFPYSPVTEELDSGACLSEGSSHGVLKSI
jgi:hypothetical protein